MQVFDHIHYLVNNNKRVLLLLLLRIIYNMGKLLPMKRLLLLLPTAFLLLCFMSMTVRGRSLREVGTTKDGGIDDGKWHQSNNNVFKPNHEGTHNNEINGDDVDTMDYTPAKKNSPIHN